MREIQILMDSSAGLTTDYCANVNAGDIVIGIRALGPRPPAATIFN